MTDRENSQLDAMVIELDRARELLEVSPPGEPMPNARRFLIAEFDHPEHELLVYQGGQFFAWNGKCWPCIEDPILRSRLYKWFENRIYIDTSKQRAEKKPFAPTVRKVADLTDALRAVTIIATDTAPPAWLKMKQTDAPADELIACQNGLIHWPSRKLYHHCPRFYSHHAVPFAFDPNAPQPERWLRFLNELWSDDASSIETLQEVFGYLVSGDTRQQKMFLLVGPKRGGKGTIARVLRATVGAHHVTGPTLASFATNFGLQDLVGKPLAIISDARLGNKTDGSIVTERLLSITGEDTLSIDRKYRDHWTGQLPTRILMLTNELPGFTDSSGALASRFIVFTMGVSFYGRENPGLTDELCEELPGIFNWALEGLERLHKRGRFEQPRTSQDAIQQLEDLASPVSAFLRDCCQTGPDQKVRRSDLYAAYKPWCDDRGYSKNNSAVFFRNIKAARPQVRRSQPREGADRLDLILGIGLRTHGRYNG